MAATVGEVLARQIRRYRKEQGLTQQALADRTKAIGVPISRDNLAKIETAQGRADSLSLTDLLVLAAALDVPPVLLFLPLGEEEEVEIIPGNTTHPHLALKWIKGSETFSRNQRSDSFDLKQWTRNAQPIRLFDKLELLQVGLEETQIPDDERHQRLIEHAKYMRDAGLTVPGGILDGVS